MPLPLWRAGQWWTHRVEAPHPSNDSGVWRSDRLAGVLLVRGRRLRQSVRRGIPAPGHRHCRQPGHDQPGRGAGPPTLVRQVQTTLKSSNNHSGRIEAFGGR
jgi:hypothetical protein